MPELAEVDYFRRCWDPGVGDRIRRVQVHPGKRIFRNGSDQRITESLPGAVLLGSEARGKRLLFRFSRHLWLGLHLGMTGELKVAAANFVPGKHDHVVLYQSERTLVFSDPRLFGQVWFEQTAACPEWWARLPESVSSTGFTRRSMDAFLRRHPKLPIKAALLLQDGFPGIGNWMADEILWRAKVQPAIRAGALRPGQHDALWKSLRLVCRGALKHVAPDFSDPPAGWLFHERWKRAGDCPLHGRPLRKQNVGGRTTVWCEECQE